MSSFRKLYVIFVLLIICASVPVFAQDSTEATATEAVKINISLTDYNFVIDGVEAMQPLQLMAGQAYQIHFKNDSAMLMTHEVLLGRNANTLKGGFKHDFAEPMLSEVEVVLTSQMNGKDFLIGVAGLNEFELSAGQEMTLEFTLSDDKIGTWEIGCFEFLSMNDTEDHPGATHFDVGMHLPVEVSAGATI